MSKTLAIALSLAWLPTCTLPGLMCPPVSADVDCIPPIQNWEGSAPETCLFDSHGGTARCCTYITNKPGLVCVSVVCQKTCALPWELVKTECVADGSI